MSRFAPPLKTPFCQRREREFLYLSEVDALVAATQKTRSPIRNQALALLLFCQALQPIELCWLRWCDVNFAENILLVTRNRSLSTRDKNQILVSLQALCPPEINLYKQLYHQRTTDWVFASERKQRLSERSLHHIIQNAGAIANLPFPVHPYMLRRSGLYYRAAILVASAGLSLGQCCLLWNCKATNVPCTEDQVQQKYSAITTAQKNAFWKALEQIKAFTGIKLFENVIDYLLGAFALDHKLQNIPDDYWLAPVNWKPQTLPKRLQVIKSHSSNYRLKGATLPKS